MLYNDNDLAVTGATVCGKTFLPSDEESSYAVFRLSNHSCGVIVEKGKRHPRLRLMPGIQIPREARGGFEPFQFECDDEQMVDLCLDRTDGELTLHRNLCSDDPAEVERVLAPALKWVDEVACPAIMAYIAKTYRELGTED